MSNEDRELLGLAAKAGRIRVKGWDHSPVTGVYNPVLQSGYWWEPLQDDGDALRLAVKLRIDLAHIIDEIHANRSHPHPNVDVVEDEGEDPYAATRRAITRAAAEIGKTLK